MTGISPLKSALDDVVTGFLGLVLFMVLVFGTNIVDLRSFFIVGGSVCAALDFSVARAHLKNLR